MTLLKRIVWIGALVVSIGFTPSRVLAQTEAVITGVVADTSGGVLPGVTVTAVHEATGNTLPASPTNAACFVCRRASAHIRFRWKLQGFQSVRAQGTLLAGQTANIPCRCSRRRCRRT
jgi:hypothetical protein